MKIGYEWGYLYAAINPGEGQLQAWLMPDMQKNTFQAFLDDLSAEVKADTLLVIDGAPAHRGKLKLPDKLHLQLLPAYSPELKAVSGDEKSREQPGFYQYTGNRNSTD